MKKQLASMIVLGTLGLGMSPAQAEGWEFLPVTGDNYEFKPKLSLITGSMDPADGSSGTMTGLELAINCPLLKAPNGVIRQQVSYASYDENGVKIDSFELNPHYQIEVAQDVTFGFGPGFGYTWAETTGLDDSSFTLQAGASLNYSLGQVEIGAEARYQTLVSDIKTQGGTEVDLDNTRLMLKVGYKF
jgi:hypothetical protein